MYRSAILALFSNVTYYPLFPSFVWRCVPHDFASSGGLYRNDRCLGLIK